MNEDKPVKWETHPLLVPFYFLFEGFSALAWFILSIIPAIYWTFSSEGKEPKKFG